MRAAMKSEIRNPKSERDPKPEAGRLPFPALALEYFSHADKQAEFGFRISGFFRISGIRISDFMARLFIALLASLGILRSQSFAAASKPNIVYILADDLGYGDVHACNPQSKIPTPNLDRLAAEGMRFTDAHAPDAVCSPTRYGLLTGDRKSTRLNSSHVETS